MICAIISTGEELLLECKNEHEMPYTEIKTKLREKIWELYRKGFNSFYVNCEYGAPLWASEIICAMKMYNNIELHIVVPHEEQSINWNEEYRDRYYNAHICADDVYTISTRCHKNCYGETEKNMINKSDILLICGKSCSDINCTRYAEKHGVECIYLET